MYVTLLQTGATVVCQNHGNERIWARRLGQQSPLNTATSSKSLASRLKALVNYTVTRTLTTYPAFELLPSLLWPSAAGKTTQVGLNGCATTATRGIVVLVPRHVAGLLALQLPSIGSVCPAVGAPATALGGVWTLEARDIFLECQPLDSASPDTALLALPVTMDLVDRLVLFPYI